MEKVLESEKKSESHENNYCISSHCGLWLGYCSARSGCVDPKEKARAENLCKSCGLWLGCCTAHSGCVQI